MRGSTSNLLIVILGGALVCQVLSAVVDLHPSSSFIDPNRHLLRKRFANPVAKPDARPDPEAKAEPHFGGYSFYRPFGFGYRYAMPYYGFGPYYGYGSFGSFGYWR